MNPTVWLQAHRKELLVGGGIVTAVVALVARERAKSSSAGGAAATGAAASGVPTAGGVATSGDDALGWLQPQLDSLSSQEGALAKSEANDAALLAQLNKSPAGGLTSTQVNDIVKQALAVNRVENFTPDEQARFARLSSADPAALRRIAAMSPAQAQRFFQGLSHPNVVGPKPK